MGPVERAAQGAGGGPKAHGADGFGVARVHVGVVAKDVARGVDTGAAVVDTARFGRIGHVRHRHRGIVRAVEGDA